MDGRSGLLTRGAKMSMRLRMVEVSASPLSLLQLGTRSVQFHDPARGRKERETPERN